MNQSFSEKLLGAAKLNSEAVGEIPLVEIYGNSRVFIENHRGILLCSDEEISVKTVLGLIRILGKDLIISIISQDYMVINGHITQIVQEVS